MTTTPRATTAPLPTAAIILCAASALLHAALTATGAADPVRMPTLPSGFAGSAAALTTALLLRPRVATGGGALLAASGTMMLAGSLLALPHTLMMTIVKVANLITDGSGSFEVEPAWLPTVTHCTTALAALALCAHLLRLLRMRRGTCWRCGRTTSHPPTPPIGRLRALAAAAIIAALPYGGLKLAWSLGLPLGLTGTAFEHAGLASPGFGDTVALTLVSVAACGAMAIPARSPVVRLPTATIGLIGSLMLVPIGLFSLGTMVATSLGLFPIDESEIAAWAFILVYACFAIWGVSLAALTNFYWHGTRPSCSVHGTGTEDADPPQPTRPSTVRP